MKMISLLIFLITLSLKAYALKSPLFPEDGSIKFDYWYYSGGKSGPRINPVTIDAIEKSFHLEGITPVIISNYPWMQDILFFNQDGDFVEQPDLPIDPSYFLGLTTGVFEDLGWSGELTRLSSNDFSQISQSNQRSIDKLKMAFLEGGATITGRFSNGENYLITTSKRFEGIKNSYQDLVNSSANDKEVKSFLAQELLIKEDNLILLDPRIGTTHLDLYIKALPNGVLLIDDQRTTLEITKKYLENDNLIRKNIIRYQETENLIHRRKSELKRLEIARKQLSQKFKVIPILGRFYEYYEAHGEILRIREKINFFNGVSGINPNGKSFYITNQASGALGLEKYWIEKLKIFGFAENNIHFPGEYSNGSGLDCMGSPAP